MVAEAGDAERARQLTADVETIARGITDPDEQARALIERAGCAGMPQAHRILGEAFVVGSLLTPLPVLAKLHPQLVVQIADEHARRI